MKLAISNIAWTGDNESYYNVMKRYRFTGLEIAPTKFSVNPYDNLAIAIKIKQNLLAKHGLSIVSMQSLLFGAEGLALFSTVGARNRLLLYMKKAIVYAKAISCPALVFGNPKNRITNDLEKDYPVALDFFYELGEFASQNNTCLCIEPNPEDYCTNFINTLHEASQLVDDVGSPGFKMIIDTSTMLLNKDDPCAVIDVIKKTKHIHISMPFLKPLNKEYRYHEEWLREFVSIIKESSYNDFISIEMSNASKEDVEQSLKLLNQLV